MKKRNLAFTVELFGLFILLVLVITVITQVFVMSRSHSIQARQLTEAVILAESAAEVSSTEKDMLQLSDKVADMENVVSMQYVSDGAQTSEGEILAGAVFTPDDKGDCKYIIRIDRKSTPSGAGLYAEDNISIYSAPDAADAEADIADISLTEPVYTLKAGKYFGEDK